MTVAYDCHSERSEESWRLQGILRRVAPRDDSGVNAAACLARPGTTVTGGSAEPCNRPQVPCFVEGHGAQVQRAAVFVLSFPPSMLLPGAQGTNNTVPSSMSTRRVGV